MNVTLPDGDFIEYVNDPLGRRIAKKINGTLIEKYLWQGQTRLLAVFDDSDNLLMRFDYADGRMPVSMTKNGETYYLAYDQTGSLKAVADTAGTVVKTIVYDSYGYVVSDSNPSFDVPFGFAGGLFDADTGLVRFGARDYDPEIGRWTAKDPILFAGGDTDLYGYVLNDPVNLVDPMGLVNWGMFTTGVLSITDGATMIGVAVVATVGTAVTTANPVLTGIVGTMMVPVAALGVYDIAHGVYLIEQSFHDGDDYYIHTTDISNQEFPNDKPCKL
jgi:RHS repeat-associated protein